MSTAMWWTRTRSSRCCCIGCSTRKGWPGDVTRAFNTTKMIDRIAAKYGRTLHEHGIGFKYVCDLMLKQEILIGGEESGGIGISRHLPERDGLLNALLLANVMADEKKTLGQLVAALQEEFGEHQYGRIDMHIDEELKQLAIARAGALAEGDTMAGMKILRVEKMDGIKFFLTILLPRQRRMQRRLGCCCVHRGRSHCCASTARAVLWNP